MKKVLLVFIFIGLIYTAFIQLQKGKIILKYNSAITNNLMLNDSLQKTLMRMDYFESLSLKNYQFNNSKLDSIQLYKIVENGQLVKSSFKNIGKERFVIRYSEIGCNTCTNLIFKRPERLKEIEAKFDLIVLVDFNRYEDFIRWKRVTEIEKDIFFVKRGDLPFDSSFGSSSYTFILDNSFMAHSFFEPYNVFPEVVHDYLDKVLN